MLFPTYTAGDLVARALVLLGVIAPGETPDAENADNAADTLNEFIDSLALQGLTVYQLLRTTKTLANGTASYTIGSGGAINIVRPTEITYAGLIQDTGAAEPLESPIKVFTDQEWARIAQKTFTSRYAEGIYYDRAWDASTKLATVYPWPIPDVGTTQLVIYTPLALATFADTSTGYTFPPGYPRMLRSNLALELAADYGKAPSDELKRVAKESLATIKRANQRLTTVNIDPSLAGTHGRGTMTGSRFTRGDF
jgi:hypothetical protein